MALDDKFVSLALKNLQDVLARSGISPEALFSKYDFDGDGFLSYDEFSKSLTSITGQSAPRAALDAIFSAIDKDGSGGLDLREVIASFGGQTISSSNDLSQSSTLEINGHANDDYNGKFMLQKTQINGHPWFKNTKNPSSPKILYYFNANSGGAPSWSLDDRIQDGSKDLYRGGWTRALADGELPLGTRRWVGIGKITISISDTPSTKKVTINDEEEQITQTNIAVEERKLSADDELYSSKTGKQQLEYLRDNGTTPTNMEGMISELALIKDALVKGVNDNSVTVGEGRIYADSVFENKLTNFPTPLKPIARSAWDSQADSIEATLLASVGIATIGASVIAANSKIDEQQMRQPQTPELAIHEETSSNDIVEINNDHREDYISPEIGKEQENSSSEQISIEEEIVEKSSNYTIDEVIEEFSKARFSAEKQMAEEKYKGENFTLNIKITSVQRTFGMNLKEEYKGGNTILAKYGKIDLEILLPNTPEYSDYSQNNEYTIDSTISSWNGIRNRLVLMA